MKRTYNSTTSLSCKERLSLPVFSTRISRLWRNLLVAFLGGAFGNSYAVNGCSDIPSGQDQKNKTWLVDAVSGRTLENGEIVPIGTDVIWHARAEAYGRCDVYYPNPTCLFLLSQEHSVLIIGRRYYASSLGPSLYSAGVTIGYNNPYPHVVDSTDLINSNGPVGATINEGSYDFYTDSSMFQTDCNMLPQILPSEGVKAHGRPQKKRCRVGSSFATFGNPCDVLNGIKVETQVDFIVGSRALIRYYSSDTSRFNVGFGFGWTSDITTKIERGGNKINVVNADGRSETFTMSLGGWSGSPDAKMTVRNSIGGGFIVTYRNGLINEFDSFGRISTSTSSRGENTSYVWSPNGTSLSIVDSFGRSIQVTLSDKLISMITLPDGRAISYMYDSERALTSVELNR